MVFADMHGACEASGCARHLKCIINTLCLLYHKFGEFMVFADMHGACEASGCARHLNV